MLFFEQEKQLTNYATKVGTKYFVQFVNKILTHLQMLHVDLLKLLVVLLHESFYASSLFPFTICSIQTIFILFFSEKLANGFESTLYFQNSRSWKARNTIVKTYRAMSRLR